MQQLFITAYAVAVVVVFAAVIGLAISDATVRRRIATLSSAVAVLSGNYQALSDSLRACEAGLNRTSNAKLAAEVADLAAALEGAQGRFRQELSSLWGKIGGRGKANGYAEPDDELQAFLDLQRAGSQK
ncbi:MAG TPA: hypothetical protein VFN76_07470 [Candidatus Limnocylindria bacterium]|nr:hypothetical protein [Candidatus Limnocylindria bacterium]